MDNGNSSPQANTQTAPEKQSVTPVQTESDTSRQRLVVAGLVIGGLVLLALIVLAIIFLANPATPTERIRDIFIIFMAFEFLLLGLALIILIVQLATLVNLLQNEIKPILESTIETSNTLRGTAVFLSDNLVEPVIQLSGYAAGMQRMLGLIGIIRKPK